MSFIVALNVDELRPPWLDNHGMNRMALADCDRVEIPR